MLAASGYAALLAEEDTQESQDRLENLAELLSAAADYEAREPSLAASRASWTGRRCCPTSTSSGASPRWSS